MLGACLRVWSVLAREGRMPIYYVPAPGKRGALYRDWLVLALCRPWSRGLVLHWHAVGLGAWLDTQSLPPERWISRLLLGRAALAIAQAEAGRADCERIAPRRCLVIRNGVPDPAPDLICRTRTATDEKRASEVIFVGLGCREKGLFDALEGVVLAHAAEPGAFRFTAIGPFASARDEDEFRARLSAAPPGLARHLGFASDTERNRLLRAADLFCFPSYYPHEGQPAVLLEALALDLPIVATRWRGIPENLPAEHIYLVEPRAPAQIAAQLRAARAAGLPMGASRRHYLVHFTKSHHHAAVLAALSTL